MTAEKKYDLVIIGAGPAGYVAAVRASRFGLKTACVEKRPRPGGVCLNVGCIPSKALLDSSEYFHLARTGLARHGIRTGKVSLDLEAMMARKDKVVEELTANVARLLKGHKVDLIRGQARLTAADTVEVTAADGGRTVLSASRAVLLATGSRPFFPPGLEPDGDLIVGSTAALAFDRVPGHLGIVGGGYIGLELGSVWLRLGAKVTVIEMLPAIAASLDGQVGRALERILRRQGFDIRTNTRVVEAKVAGKKVEVTLEKEDKREKLRFDRLLVAVGRKPLTEGLGLEQVGVKTDPASGHVIVDSSYRTSVDRIYAVGDLVPGPMLAHKASAEALAAVEGLAGRFGEVNYDAMPAVVYTWPEVAAVGLTEEQVKQRQVPYCVGTYPFSGAGRARCMGQSEGFVKLIAHAKTDRILGVHIIGARAADMIAEGVLAMEFGASAEDIARTIHGHPTFSEALMEAAMAVGNCSVYSS